MGALIRSKDWSQTPLGAPDTWPQSLRTSVSLCMASNFPIAIVWGPQQVQIYNDGYWPITGDMHPKSMGQDFKECWISAWPVIGQAFEEAFLGATRFLETQRIFLDRYGYSEETFFTFSFSPILDETGGVGGLFHPVIEQTQQTLAERRLNILPAVANHTVNARTPTEASALIMDCLKDFELDIPFVLLYSMAADGKEANLEGSVGVERGSPLAPAKINLEEHPLKSWPFNEVIQNGKSVQVEKLAEMFGAFHCGPYPEPPEQALVFPVILPGADYNNYFLVAGVSARRRLDEKYLLFYELLTASVTNVLTKAGAYEEERKKAETLAEIDKAKTVFFSNISHEFRTPLTLMLSPLEELLNQEKNNFSESEKENIKTSHRNAIRLLKLVNTLLDFSRIESGRQQGVFSLMDIAALTKNLASNFRSVIEKAGLKLIVQADAIIQPVYVDKYMWEKIVFNLLSNAFKYTLEGIIIVELTSEKDFAVLKIKDTGVGIPENELPKMFERFHRVQNVIGRTYEGTGIGLSLIKELVQMHHGTIGVESKLNEGSVFTVKIPFGKEHLDGHLIANSEMDADEIYSTIYIDEAEILLNTENIENSTAKHGKLHLSTVLVVDDNADMREHISSILSNNFNVITANNGMDALHRIKETIPDLVLSDIMMPVMDGIGLLKEIKSNKSTENIPVIFLTARAGEESRIEGWETGADDYLVKPFSAKELLSRVRAQIKLVKLRQSLESNVRNLFLEAPAVIGILRGPQHVLELANEMYLQMAGNRDIVGKPIREALPELKGQGFYEILDKVYTTGEPFIGNEIPTQLNNGNGKLEKVYLNFVYQPSHNNEGEIDGILVHGVDVTEQVLARKTIEESEKRQAFVLKISDVVRTLTHPVDIEEAVTKIAMDFMDADWCHYCTIEEDNLIIMRDAVRGDLLSVAGVYLISSYALFKTVLDKGHPFVVDDVHTTDILDEELKQLCVQLQNISFINVPVIKNGKPVGMLSLVQSRPRKWTDQEVQLTIETAERTWAAVERAKVEEALRSSEEKYRTLFHSIDEAVSTIDVIFDNESRATDFRFIENNAAFTKLTGLPEDLIGKRWLEFIPTIDPFIAEIFERVIRTGEAVRAENYVKNLDKWHNTYFTLSGGAGSNRIICVYTDITERKRREAHLMFLAGINLDFAPLLTAQQVMNQVAERLANFLHLSRCHFSIIDEEQDRLEVLYDFRADEKLPSVMGVHHISDLITEEGRRYYQAGKMVVLNTAAGSTLVKAPAQMLKEWGIGSLVDLPHLEAGKWKFLLSIIRAEVSEWRDDEIELLQELTSRIFIRVERARAEEALCKSEERLRLATQASDIYWWEFDFETNTTLYSSNTEQVTGTAPAKTMEENLLFLHPDDRKLAEQAFEEAINNSTDHFNFVVRSIAVPSEIRWLHVSGRIIRDNHNKSVLAVGISQNITERKQAEEKIKESEIRYHEMINSSPSMISILKGEDMIIEIANDAILESWGKGKYIIGKSLISVMPEIVEQGFAKMLLSVFKTGEAIQGNEAPVTLLRNGTKELLYYNFIYQAQRNVHGEIEGVAIIATEVTSQAELHKKIKSSEEKFRNVLLQSPGLFVILKGPEMVIDFVNESLLRSWGRTNDIIGKTLLEALPEIKDQAFPELLAEVYKTGEIYFGKEEKTVIIKDGQPEDVYYNYVYQPICQEDGTISGITVMATDITEQVIVRKKIEESEKLLEQKVIQRTEQLEEKNTELQKMNKELEAFTYISSHDLQEPLRKIQTFADRIIATEKEHLSDTAKDYFSRMQSSATRMQTLIEDLLAFSRISTSERKFAKTDLFKIVDEVKEEFKEAIEEKNATIITGEMGEANIIPFQFHQLMHNLIGNALKFSKQDAPPIIVIKSELLSGSNSPFENRGACHLSVSDNGIGFEKQFSERIFGVFQRLHGKAEYTGTGIGLAIVKKIVDNHNGIITAESELGKGATFDIYLPV